MNEPYEQLLHERNTLKAESERLKDDAVDLAHQLIQAQSDNEDLKSALAKAEDREKQLRIRGHTLTDWQLGGIAMLRSMKATLQLLREGKWTLDDADKWVEEQLK